MLQLLLDEHISNDVAIGFRRRNKRTPIFAVAEFQNRRLLSYPDHQLLQEAHSLKLTLVTYDLRTIPPVLRTWADETRPHSAVIFVDEKTIAPSDIGAQVRALLKFAAAHGQIDWENRIIFLSR